MANTTNLILPLMSAAQSQKHITHNDALIRLDALVQLAVINSLTVPPVGPAEGDRYLVGSAATGAWAGKDLNVAVWTGGLWVFLVPKEGWFCWNETTNLILVWNGSAWIDIATAGSFVSTTTINNGSLPGQLTMLGLGGAVADATNKLSVNTPSVLFNRGATDINVTLNKGGAANDASLTFQSGFSARALVGLLGNDDFTFKVTPDGSTYKTAMVIDKDTGSVDFFEHSKFSAYVNFDRYVAADTWTLIDNNNARHNDQGDWGSGLFTAPHDGYYLFGAGYRFKANSTVPTDIRIGLSVNAAAPLADRIATSGDATIVTLQSMVQITGLIKLTAGQTVSARAFMSGFDGYVEAYSNYFWGCQIA